MLSGVMGDDTLTSNGHSFGSSGPEQPDNGVPTEKSGFVPVQVQLVPDWKWYVLSSLFKPRNKSYNDEIPPGIITFG